MLLSKAYIRKLLMVVISLKYYVYLNIKWFQNPWLRSILAYSSVSLVRCLMLQSIVQEAML